MLLHPVLFLVEKMVVLVVVLDRDQEAEVLEIE
jgi:hypothetical protein